MAANRNEQHLPEAMWIRIRPLLLLTLQRLFPDSR